MGLKMNQSDTERKQSVQAKEGRQQGLVRTYSKWQLFFLDRMQRMAEVNRETENGAFEDFEVKILKRAMFSTLLDCDEAGVGEEARGLISTSAKEHKV